MAPGPDTKVFRETYGALRNDCLIARERPSTVPEKAVCGLWYDRLASAHDLSTDDGRALKVWSPGWWNLGAGPDFRNAQLELNGRLFTGDVEVHLSHADWIQHGHHLDPRYDEVILEIILAEGPPKRPPCTSRGKKITTLSLEAALGSELTEEVATAVLEAYPYAAPGAAGRCAEVAREGGHERLAELVRMAGEWRVLAKTRRLREATAQYGPEQAVYEAFMTACGFGPLKHNFQMIARHFPYDRARQLAREDPFLLEAGLFQIAGLLPGGVPEGGGASPHFARLRELCAKRLPGLQSLPLAWPRLGLRPTNYPERRLAGAARFIARTAGPGLSESLERIWEEPAKAVARRRSFEALFGKALGFWATHCTWSGRALQRPAPPLGTGRVRSIIGNVFVPAALAAAREGRDRLREERVFDFFTRLPKEPDNRIVRIMMPRLFGQGPRPRADFRLQQGLLQINQDWCADNPSCHNCRFLEGLERLAGGGDATGG